RSGGADDLLLRASRSLRERSRRRKTSASRRCHRICRNDGQRAGKFAASAFRDIRSAADEGMVEGRSDQSVSDSYGTRRYEIFFRASATYGWRGLIFSDVA